MKQYNPRCLSVVVATCLMGCATETPSGVDELTGFLRDGRTTREEVKLRLGEPSGVFEAGRLLTYRVGYDQIKHCHGVIPREGTASGWPDWTKADYSLVLLFENSVLLQHKLIKVK